MVWHVDKYKITFKLVINWTNEILQHIVVSSGLSRPGIIDTRARYWSAVRRLRNTALDYQLETGQTRKYTATYFSLIFLQVI
jgi:hypothetical protein